MQIRKNTKAFKTIVSILEACKDRPDRSELVRLFITRAGQTVNDRLYIEAIETEKDLFYDLNYQAIVNNLQSAGYQLHVSDEHPGIYFLRGSNKTWDETPFEFAEIILKKFAGLPELPAVRKKEAHQKYALPTAKEASAPTPAKRKPEKAPAKFTTAATKQPAFHLKHEIEFTNLERFVYTQAKLSKRAVLDHYDKISDHLLPWLKDRALWVRPQADTPTDSLALNKALWSIDSSVVWPKWIQQRSEPKESPALLCNDREHLFFYLERGCLEFSPAHARFKSPAFPDYVLLTLDSTDLAKTIDAALATREVLTGLQLPSFIKTDGQAGFHIYIPLDAESAFAKSSSVAAYIGKLVRLKIPDLVTLNTQDEMTYGKVSLSYHLNADDQRITAPYSLIPGSSPAVATPLRWDEVQHDLRPEDFTVHTIPKRLNQEGDPFEAFFKKKVSASKVLQRLQENYSFLF